MGGGERKVKEKKVRARKEGKKPVKKTRKMKISSPDVAVAESRRQLDERGFLESGLAGGVAEDLVLDGGGAGAAGRGSEGGRAVFVLRSRSRLRERRRSPRVKKKLSPSQAFLLPEF